MASVHNFRSALNGFNREDVVHYIEFINNRSKSQLEQMQGQLRVAQSREQELLARVDEAQARVRELEEKLKSVEAGEPGNATEEELEAYRRAERAERLAQERADQIYAQAQAVLTSATANAQAAAGDISALTEQLMELLAQYRTCAQSACETFRDAAASLENIEK